MASTTATETAVANLPEDQRRKIVDKLCDDVMAARLDPGTALLMLDCLGLTGDRDVFSHALAARYMRDGLRDGTIDPFAVDPDIRIGRQTAIDMLSDGYDAEYVESLTTLATVRLLPGQVAS